MAKKYTLDDIKTMDKLTLSPDEVAGVMSGTSAHAIRLAARTEPELLGFPTIVMGTRVKIPRVPFIRFMEGVVADGQTD